MWERLAVRLWAAARLFMLGEGNEEVERGGAECTWEGAADGSRLWLDIVCFLWNLSGLHQSQTYH